MGCMGSDHQLLEGFPLTKKVNPIGRNGQSG
jgi:hypothetical protein